MPNAPTKRKAADGPGDPSRKCAKADDSENSPPHLPASCLAAVLNFLPYADVRKCLLAGKIMAVDAANQVEALNLLRVSEMFGPAARRFANVSELNILCLISYRLGQESQVLSVQASTRAIPFMAMFPKLRKAFIGGRQQDDLNRNVWHREGYDQDICHEPHDHQTIFNGFVENLCGAFEAQLLSLNLKLGGFSFMQQLKCSEKVENDIGEREGAWPCRCCRRILATFPTECLLRWHAQCLTHDLELCVPIADRLEIFAKRRGGSHFLRSSEGKELIVSVVNAMITTWGVGRPHLHERNFATRMVEQGGAVDTPSNSPASESVGVMALFPWSARRLMQAIAVIFERCTDSIPPKLFGSSIPFCLRPGIYVDGRKHIVLRQTFDALVSCGFDLDPNGLILVDLHDEPALASLRDAVERNARN